VSVRAVAAPVSEVLDSIARQTGMKVIYDAPLPRQALTTTFEDRAPAEAVLSLLEGLGVNYALVMDGSGARVDRLLLLGTLSAAAPAPSTVEAAPSQPQFTSRLPRTPEREQAAADDEDADGDPPETLTPEQQENRLAGKTAGETPAAASAPPQYPSSSFTPRLPMPVRAPSANPQAQEDSPKNP